MKPDSQDVGVLSYRIQCCFTIETLKYIVFSDTANTLILLTHWTEVQKGRHVWVAGRDQLVGAAQKEEMEEVR